VRAQSKHAPILIGVLNAGSSESNAGLLAAFKQTLADLGRTEGSNVVFEGRWADGRMDRLPGLGGELAAMGPAVIVAGSVSAAVAVTKAAPMTPNVYVGGDPIAAGLPKSLAHPGGMVTGVSNFGTFVSVKYLELPLDAAPGLRRFGFMFDSNIPNHSLFMANARHSVAQYSVEGRYAEVARPDEIETALARLASEGVQALVLMPSQAIEVGVKRIVQFALTRRWPVIAGQRRWANEGAQLSYAADRAALYRRAAHYVDRILKGTKPGDLPIEQATTFELAVNMKTAKLLGLTMPPAIMVRATRVIQ
jgi:putative ABC transport system substrate-binding protein